MTLEQLFKTSLVRIALLPLGWVVAAASAFFPSVPRHIVKKMRELFSPRLNDLLYEKLFLYNQSLRCFVTVPRFISTNTPIPIDLTLEMKDYVQAHFYFHGMPSFFLHLLAFCDSRTAFFDVGANMGLISVGISRFIPDENIFAFEALPSTYEHTCRVFKDNCPEASAFLQALSDKDGELVFHIPETDSGSASASESPEEIKSGRSKALHIQTQRVPCKTFDAVYAGLTTSGKLLGLGRHAFKIDVEGHEVEVLQGMSGYFDGFHGEIILIVEVRQKCADQVHNILEDKGFSALSPEVSADGMKTRMRDCIYTRPFTESPES